MGSFIRRRRRRARRGGPGGSATAPGRAGQWGATTRSALGAGGFALGRNFPSRGRFGAGRGVGGLALLGVLGPPLVMKKGVGGVVATRGAGGASPRCCPEWGAAVGEPGAGSGCRRANVG